MFRSFSGTNVRAATKNGDKNGNDEITTNTSNNNNNNNNTSDNSNKNEGNNQSAGGRRQPIKYTVDTPKPKNIYDALNLSAGGTNGQGQPPENSSGSKRHNYFVRNLKEMNEIF